MFAIKKWGWLLLLTVFVGCATQKNMYMTPKTAEYQKVTQNFMGKWSIVSHRIGDQNTLDRTFEKGMLDLDFQTRTAKFTFWVSDAYVGEKINDWKSEYPGLKVDEYKVISTAQWGISKSGEIIYFDNVKNSADIRGSGENFESFFQMEKTKFAASENVGKGGGLMGLAMNLATKSATGTQELFPQIPGQSNFNFSRNQQNVTINSNASLPAVHFKLVKTW